MNEAQRILQLTGGGLAVFMHYLGEKCLAKTFRNPFREDSRPSCHLYVNRRGRSDQQYYLQDFGDSSFCGNCFSIVAKLCNINTKTNFREVLQTIDRDLSLGVFDGQCRQVRVVMPKPAIITQRTTTSSIANFEVATQPFMPWEETYWGQYGIDLTTLERYNVKSVSSCTFVKNGGGKFAVYSSKAVPTYGYFFDNGKGLKVYRPKAKTRFLYAGHLPKPYVFGYEQLPKEGDIVFITGGEKDVLSLAAHGFAALTFNSETASIPEKMLDALSARFKRIIFLYDTDETGRRESALRVKQYGSSYAVSKIDLPLTGTKSEKDISDFFRLGHTSAELLFLLETTITPND